MTVADRLLARREVDPLTGCWNWTGSVAKAGYGQINLSGGNQSSHVHRVAAALWIEEPGDRHVLHRCDNKRCFNPDHLFLGTHAENMRDAQLKGRSPCGERNGHAKRTWAEVEEIRALAASGMPQRMIADLRKTPESIVSRIVRGTIWKRPR